MYTSVVSYSCFVLCALYLHCACIDYVFVIDAHKGFIAFSTHITLCG